jgi:hypothetical protein
MRAFGVGCFVAGVASLITLVIRRGQGLPLRGIDYTMMFVGIAGTIVGIAAVFVQV